VSCYAAEVDQSFEPPAGMRFQGLRSLYGLMDEDYFWVGGRAIQIVDWERTHRFCGRCGAPTQVSQHERSRECPTCGLIAYPRLAPAIIVAVTHKGKILLARSHRHPPGFHSVLAGFVEPGETLEECVIREVHEEVGLPVTDLRYFGSQPWPFPHSLMIAFTCESLSEQIKLQDSELAEAAWFAPDELPNVPPPLTISRHLIDAFAAGMLRD
jgi:NAD+ diphosphatase